jgi:hypothetical protein
MDYATDILIPSSFGRNEYIIVALSFLGTLLYPALIINLFRMKGPVCVSNYFASISEVRQSISSTE